MAKKVPPRTAARRTRVSPRPPISPNSSRSPATVQNATSELERQRAEETLRESEAKYAALFEKAAVPMILTKMPAGVLVDVNEAFQTAFGYTRQEIVGKTSVEIGMVRSEERAQAYADLDESGFIQNDETHIYTKSGEIRDCLVNVNPVKISGGDFVITAIYDITARRQAEQALMQLNQTLEQRVAERTAALRDSEAHYYSAIKHAAITFAQVDRDLRYIWIQNPHPDFPSETVIGKRDDELMDNEGTKQLMQMKRQVIEMGHPLRWEIDFPLPDGLRTYDIVAEPIRNSAEQVVGAATCAIDITERKRVEEALRETNAFNESMLQTIPFGLDIVDEQGNILYLNSALEAAVGKAAVGKTCWLAYKDNQKQCADCPLKQQIEIGETKSLETAGALGRKTFEITHTGMVYRGQKAILEVFYDITARKRAEEIATHRLADLEAVSSISTVLRTAQTLEEMLPRLLDEMLAVLDTNVGIIFIHDAARDELRKAVARGWFAQIADTPLKASEDMAGSIMAMNQPYRTREFVSDPRWREWARDLMPAGWGGIAIPIRATQEILGVLWIAVPLPRELNENEGHLLSTIVEIAGNAIQRLRLHAQTQRRLEYIQAVHMIDVAINSSFDLRVTLDILLDHVIRQLQVDAAAVLLFNRHLNRLEFGAARGFRGSGITRLSLRMGEDYAGQVALGRRLINVPNLKEIDRPFSQAHLTAGEDFVAYYGAPLIAKGQIKGVLEIFQRAPFQPDAEWIEILETLASQTAVAIDNSELFDDLQRSNQDLALAYDATIEGWSRALDLRDKETEGHTQRVTEITDKLARAMGMREPELIDVRRGALLHDIGKMGVPDTVLFKPSALTNEEWAVMRRHPTLAYELLAPIVFLQNALDIPYCHHEKWDGTGYPRGLKGEEIPFAARLFAIVDVWDALCSNRPYREAWHEDQVHEYLRQLSGKHFDPKVVDAFFGLLDSIFSNEESRMEFKRRTSGYGSHVFKG